MICREPLKVVTTQECWPNRVDCPACEDLMEWDSNQHRYECLNCQEIGPSGWTPNECCNCGRAWPWNVATSARRCATVDDGRASA